MAKQTAEQIVQDSTTEALARSGEAANEMIRGNADALTESGNASRAAVQELTKAYQELATKNVRNLTAAMQALVGVKSPTEYIELQQRLIKEGVETTVGDSQTHGPIDHRSIHCGFRAGHPPGNLGESMFLSAVTCPRCPTKHCLIVRRGPMEGLIVLDYMPTPRRRSARS